MSEIPCIQSLLAVEYHTKTKIGKRNQPIVSYANQNKFSEKLLYFYKKIKGTNVRKTFFGMN